MAGRGGGANMKASLSADDVGTSAKKPGKLSANAIAKFESDLAFGGSTGAIPRVSLSPSSGHVSSSEMGSTSASQEHIQPYRPHSVQICEPNEEMQAAGGERESGDRNAKKRKSIWKWNPLKKVRRFFSRKKSSRRTKSCEDLPTESYRPKESLENLTADSRPRGKTSPVVRTSTMPSSNKSPSNVLQELKKRQTSSHEEVRDEMSPSFTSKTLSLPSLDTGVPPLKEYAYSEEAAVSFESDPNSSSLEGLQAAHDKIKAAPKRRRPPSRNRSGSATSALSADSPARKEQRTPHRRSKTDLKDLTKDNSFESSSLSDILNNTIFERAEEEDEQKLKSPPAATKVIDKDKAVLDDIMSRVDKAMASTSGPPKFASREEVKETEKGVDRSSLNKTEKDETNKTTVSRFEAKKESQRYSLDEKTRKSFTESVVTSKSESDILKAESSGLLQSEPLEKLWEDTKASSERKSWASTPKQPESNNNWTSTPKPVPDSNKKEERTSLTSSLKQPESNNKETNWTSTPKPVAHTNKKEESQATKNTQDKQTQITTKPAFKRGKSWSNNYKPRMVEFPVKQEAVMIETKKDSPPVSTAEDEEKENEDTSSFEEKKDFRFSRTKSWSYGMKPGDVGKANQGLKSGENKTTSSTVEEEKKGDAPTWIAQANRMSKRISQLLQEDESSSDEKQTPTLRKSIKESSDKPRASPKPEVKTPEKPKPLTKVAKEPAPSQSSSKPTPSPKPSLTTKPSPAPRPGSTAGPKPSSFVRNSGSLPRITGSGSSVTKSSSSSSGSAEKESIRKRANTETAKKSVQEIARSSFGNVKIEKCIVCGTTVYQMEKCKFDDSVLHRNCIKCSVCKRHLTVGNFVMTESKIYCKPHSQTVVAVST